MMPRKSRLVGLPETDPHRALGWFDSSSRASRRQRWTPQPHRQRLVRRILGVWQIRRSASVKPGGCTTRHYAGHGPSTVELFRRLWGMEAPRVVHPPQAMGQQSLLFD